MLHSQFMRSLDEWQHNCASHPRKDQGLHDLIKWRPFSWWMEPEGWHEPSYDSKAWQHGKVRTAWQKLQWLVCKRRNPGCIWDRNEDSNESMKWTNHKHAVEKEKNPKKKSLKSKTVKVQEFVNRCGCMSSCAHGINCISAVHHLDRTQVAQPVYVALLTPSQMQFQQVITSMMEMKKSTHDETSNMYQEFYEKTNDLGLKWGGGPLPRFQG